MFTLISLFLTIIYITLMTVFFNTWYLVLIWLVSGILVFYLTSILQIVISAYLFLPYGGYDKKIKNTYFRGMAWWLMVFIFNARIKIEGEENIPAEGSVVFYANHKSKIDPVYVYQAIRRPHGYAAKSDLRKIRLMDNINKAMGSFYIYRDDNRKTLKELLQGIKRAKDGHPFVIFPEGGTMYRDHEDIREVRPGSFKISLKGETDIVPITIHGSNQWANRKFYLKPIKVKVQLHPLIRYEDIKELDTNEVANLVIDTINSTIK